MSGPFDDLIPQKAPGAIAPKGMIYSPPADSLGQQTKAAELQSTQQRNAVAAATQRDQITESHAKATKAVTDAQNAQEAQIDPATAHFYAQQILSGGQMPSFGMGAVGALNRNIVMKEVARTAGASGMDGADLARQVAHYKSGTKQLETLENQLGTIRANEQTALANGQQFLERSQELPGQTSMPIVNSVVQGLQKNLPLPGHDTKAAMDAAWNTFTTEYAKVVAGSPSGAGTLSDSARHEAQAVMQGNYSLDQKQAVFQQMKADMANRLAASEGSINDGYKHLTMTPGYQVPNSLNEITVGKQQGGNQPPIVGAGPPNVPPGGSPPRAPGAISPPDYSGIGGGPNMAAATGGTRNVYNPVVSAKLNTLIHAGKPVEEGNAILPSGTPPIDAKTWDAAVSYASNHKNWNAAEATQSIPTTLGERLSASAPAAAIAGFGAGSTAGLQDVVGHTLAGKQWDANRAAIAAMHPVADTAGNIAGGVAGSLAAPELLSRFAPGAATKLGAFAEANPIKAAVGGDALFGGTYGASENPNHPVSGGLLGALTGAGAGIAGRKLTSGIASAISPSAGPFAPLYAAGGSPTIGQKLSATGGVTGKIVNTAEQAMQSFPGLGMMVAGARQAPRDAAQVGAFNRSLTQLSPFTEAGHDIGTALPSGVGPGTAAHAFTSDQFHKAYDIARSGMQFVPDQQYMSEANALSRKVGSGVLSPDQAKQVGDVVNSAVVGRLQSAGGALNGDAYKAASSDLGSAIRTWGKNPSTAPMADALSDYATIFDNAARRNSDPAAVHLLDSADRGYAQFVRIQRASELGGAGKEAGTFNPLNYAQATKQMGGGVRSNAYNQGNALGQDYANAILPLRDTLPNSGTSERLLTSQALAGLGGGEIGAGGFLAAHPGSLAPFAAYIPGVRDVVNRAIAPNAQRLSFMPPPAIASIDALGSKLDDLAPFIGKGAIPGALAYYGGGQ